MDKINSPWQCNQVDTKWSNAALEIQYVDRKGIQIETVR